MSRLEEKKQIVEEIKSKFLEAQSAVLVDYRGLNVEQITELREKFRQQGVDYKVYKHHDEIRCKGSWLGRTLEYLGPTAGSNGGSR